MKKLFFAAAAALLCICTSCETKMDTTTDTEGSAEQRNLAAFETVNKAFETGDVRGLDSVLADDFLDHTDRGDVKGKDSLKAMVSQMHSKFPDMKNETVHQVADGDYVYGWMRYTGTSDGSMGMPKGPYDMQSMEVVKFNSDGKATEHWAFMEMQDMMEMMGGGAPPVMKDSTMK